MKHSHYFLSVIVALGLTSCSGIKHYPESLDKNVHIYTETDSGSMFSSVNATVDIYRVDGVCGVEHEGTVQLDDATVNIGIPPARENRLVFVFASSTLTGNNGPVSYETLLATRDGYDYDVRVRFQEGTYEVTLIEKQVGGTDSRELPPRRLTCTPHPEPSIEGR